MTRESVQIATVRNMTIGSAWSVWALRSTAAVVFVACMTLGYALMNPVVPSGGGQGGSSVQDMVATMKGYTNKVRQSSSVP